MQLREKWLVAALVAVIAVAGWFGWRSAQWRQVYFADTIGQLTYDVEMARRQLVRARDSATYQQKVDAMATAHGYLVSAQAASGSVLERLAPSRQGRPAYMPGMYVPMLLQYARDLTPDLESQALQKRIDLLEGLEAALKAGRTDRLVRHSLSYYVNPSTLKRSLDDYFQAMPHPEGGPRVLHLADEPNTPTLSAGGIGTDVWLRVDWRHTFRLFPHSAPSRLLLIRPTADVRSDAGAQERMGAGALAPFTVAENQAELHARIKPQLPEGWGSGDYVAVRIPEGLPQTLTLRFRGGASPELLLVDLRSEAPAVPIPIGEP